MTKKEFLERQRLAAKSNVKILVLWFAVLLGSTSLLVETHQLGSVLLMLAMIPVVTWLVHSNQKRCGMVCPSCSKPTYGKASPVVIATGNCGYCGDKILSDG